MLNVLFMIKELWLLLRINVLVGLNSGFPSAVAFSTITMVNHAVCIFVVSLTKDTVESGSGS